MLIEQALRTHALTLTPVTALISSRFYYVQAPEDTADDYVVMTKVSNVGHITHDGAHNSNTDRIQLSIFSKSYATAKAIAAALKGNGSRASPTGLDCYTGNMGGASGVTVGGCFHKNEIDLGFETESEQYHVACDYRISYTQ